MPPVRTIDAHCHASSPGTVSALAAEQTHAPDASIALTTRQAQADGTSTTLTSNQADTSDPTTVSTTGQHGDGDDETMEDPSLVEPDQQAFQPIFTGRLVWSAKQSDKPAVPFKELPLPRSDRARVPPCTVYWQFVHNFNLNQEEDIA
ncbi:uncharacterized protein UDID_18287 [Ustilago sp. UG-2017a]|nr:uncharacterized protein UDID_18287 [Ustilago sp. UG-2017a]